MMQLVIWECICIMGYKYYIRHGIKEQNMKRLDIALSGKDWEYTTMRKSAPRIHHTSKRVSSKFFAKHPLARSHHIWLGRCGGRKCYTILETRHYNEEVRPKDAPQHL